MRPIQVSILQAGYCTCPEHLAIQGGRWRGIHFPAMFALLIHPSHGPMLFDTGYSFGFFHETLAYPARLYRLFTPVTFREEQGAVRQLAKFNLKASDITRVFISHFHADHISALSEFKRAKYVYIPQAFESVRHLGGFRAFSRSFMPGLLPPDFELRSDLVNLHRVASVPGELGPFKNGFDLIGDGSIIGIELPGHARGQMGIFVQSSDNQTFFFVADAAWLARAVSENRPPPPLIKGLFSDPAEYDHTLADLHLYHTQNPGVILIPSHCTETLERYADAG